MAETLQTAPYWEVLADKKGYITPTWLRWFVLTLLGQVNKTAIVIGLVSKTGQTASLPTTGVPLPALSSGLYRVSWYQRVTTPDGVSSSLTTTISWTESGVALSSSGAAMTGDTTTTTQSGSLMIRIDGSTAISYATTYASNTPAKMTYRLDVTVEQMGVS